MRPRVTIAERVAASVLRLYPRRFRRAFGEEVVEFARHRAAEPRHATPAGRLRLWLELLADGAAGAAREQAAALRDRRRLVSTPAPSVVAPEPPEDHMGTLVQDIRYALRTLRRRPGFAAVSTITLALGIGANTAIFSVVDALMLRPLRYPRPDEIVVVTAAKGAATREPVSYPDFLAWRERTRSFQDMAVARWQSVNLTGGEAPERLSGSFVSATFLTLLGGDPLVGRSFRGEEAEVGTARPVAVISEGLWRRRFGGAPSVVGRVVALNGQPFTIIGIIPATFSFFGATDVWLPITYYPNAQGLTRQDRSLTVVARLRPDVTPAQADAEMRSVAARLAAEYPVENGGFAARVHGLRELLVENVRPRLYVLVAAVAIVLLIACANVANLQLAHAVTRRREISVRAALGAGRWRLARQLLTESVLVAIVGGVLGVLLAYVGVKVLVSIIPIDLTFFHAIAVDARVLSFALVLAVGTGIVFGLAPALHGSRPSLGSALSARGGASAALHAGRFDLRAVFVVVQVALSVILLVAAGLLARTLAELRRVDLGFDPANLLTMEFRLPATKYAEPHQISQFFTQAIAEIRRVPGVEDAALVRAIPLSGNGEGRTYEVDRLPAGDPAQAPTLQLNTVSPGYFRTVRLPLVAGRDVTEHDRIDAPGVVVVSETLARRAWPGQPAIGKRLRFVGSEQWLTVVGVARDAKHFAPTDPPRAQAYIPYMQVPQIFTSVVVRGTSDVLSLGPLVRDAIWRVDPDQPVWRIRTMESLVDGARASHRVILGLIAVFAGVAVVLAAVGVYGVMSFAVMQRTHEVGVRMALGARAAEVLRLIVIQGARLTAIALGVGLVAAAGAARVLASQLFGVTPSDPLTFATVPLVLGAVALLACYLPARRASRLDPVVALRKD